jgi:hypothetical protein
MEPKMTTNTDIEYLSRRVEEERQKAEHADDPAGYRIHTEFAREYERRIQALIAAQSQSLSSK